MSHMYRGHKKNAHLLFITLLTASPAQYNPQQTQYAIIPIPKTLETRNPGRHHMQDGVLCSFHSTS